MRSYKATERKVAVRSNGWQCLTNYNLWELMILGRCRSGYSVALFSGKWVMGIIEVAWCFGCCGLLFGGWEFGRAVLMCDGADAWVRRTQDIGDGGRPFKMAWLWGMLGDSRGIFLTAESAQMVARFRPAMSLLGRYLVEIALNSLFSIWLSSCEN